MPYKKQFCTFYLDRHFIGIEVEKVQEVIRYQPITPVPLAEEAVRGLINLRGRIVTAVDLRTPLELPKWAEDQQPMNVILRTEEGGISLLVDEIGDVFDVSDEDFERPPETLGGAVHDFIRGVYKLNNNLLIALDSEKVVRSFTKSA